MTRRTPPPSRLYPKMQKVCFVPTLTNEEIMRLPLVRGDLVADSRIHLRNQYEITEAGKAYINDHAKEGKQP